MDSKAKDQLAQANMHLATLCDLVLGDDSRVRSNGALIRATGALVRERDKLREAVEALYEIAASAVEFGVNDRTKDNLDEWRSMYQAPSDPLLDEQSQAYFDRYIAGDR